MDDVFARLARMILTKIELGEINPDDPNSGIQYGEAWTAGASDGGSIKSYMTFDEAHGSRRKRRPKSRSSGTGWIREWEDVFKVQGARRRGRGCC